MSLSSRVPSSSLTACTTLTALLVLAAGCDSDGELHVEAQDPVRCQELPAPGEEEAAAEELEEAAAQGKSAAQDYIAFAHTVEDHTGEANRCYKAALADDPSLDGRVVLAFTLEADGAVREIQAEEDTIGHAVTECLTAAARSWRFPAPKVGPMALRYPFVFTLAPDTSATEAGVEEAGAEAESGAELKVAVHSTDGSEGGLDRDIIRRIVRAHIDEVRFCYNAGLGRDPGLEGRVITEFKIDGDGAVAALPTVKESVGDAEVDACIAGAVQRWRFPKTRGGEAVLVTYPFVLSPG